MVFFLSLLNMGSRIPHARIVSTSHLNDRPALCHEGETY